MPEHWQPNGDRIIRRIERERSQAHEHYQPQIDELIKENNLLADLLCQWHEEGVDRGQHIDSPGCCATHQVLARRASNDGDCVKP